MREEGRKPKNKQATDIKQAREILDCWRSGVEKEPLTLTKKRQVINMTNHLFYTTSTVINDWFVTTLWLLPLFEIDLKSIYKMVDRCLNKKTSAQLWCKNITSAYKMFKYGVIKVQKWCNEWIIELKYDVMKAKNEVKKSQTWLFECQLWCNESQLWTSEIHL